MTARTWTLNDPIVEHVDGIWRLGTVVGVDGPMLAIRFDGGNRATFRDRRSPFLRDPDDVPIDERHWVPESVRDQLVRQEAAGRLRAMAVALDHDPGLLELAKLMDDLVGPGGGGWLLTGGWVSTADLLRAARALLAPTPEPATTS